MSEGLQDSLDCVLRRKFFPAKAETLPYFHTQDDSHPVDHAIQLYLSGNTHQALAVLHRFREETARDPLAAGVERQLQAMLGSIALYLLLDEFAVAGLLILRTSEVVEKILVGRDRRKHYSVSISLLSLALVVVYFSASVDRKFLLWLISDANLLLFRRSAPQLLPLMSPLLLLAGEDMSLTQLRRKFIGNFPVDAPAHSLAKTVLIQFRPLEVAAVETDGGLLNRKFSEIREAAEKLLRQRLF